MVQYILLALIIIAALVYTGRAVYRMFKAPVKGVGCDSCDGCGLKK